MEFESLKAKCVSACQSPAKMTPLQRKDTANLSLLISKAIEFGTRAPTRFGHIDRGICEFEMVDGLWVPRSISHERRPAQKRRSAAQKGRASCSSWTTANSSRSESTRRIRPMIWPAHSPVFGQCSSKWQPYFAEAPPVRANLGERVQVDPSQKKRLLNRLNLIDAELRSPAVSGSKSTSHG